VSIAGSVPAPEHAPLPELFDSKRIIPEAGSSGPDDWEIDSSQLKFLGKVKTGSSGDL